ncbi:MAG: histidinol-phosphatase [Gammaproteobacteria bacterium]|nr:histidinol-phosphatase [Gammaproteobacteria bacterium]
MSVSETPEFLKRFAIKTATAGGQATLRWFRQAVVVHNKEADGSFDPVTAADRACERLIRSRIRAQYPNHAIRGEEFGDEGLHEWTWIVDPIDGTRAFMSGFLHWGVLLGLLRNGEPYLGVMVQPFTGEIFVGDGSSATYLRHGESRTLSTRKSAVLADALFATTDPRLFATLHDQSLLQRIEARVRLTRYGCDCYQYALVALGELDLVVENQLKPWDILPLVPIVRGAGGVVTNWQGLADLTSGEAIAAANPILHEQVLATISNS